MQTLQTTHDKNAQLTIHRQLHNLRSITPTLQNLQLSPLEVCEAILAKQIFDSDVQAFFSSLPDEERYYWISSLYAILMPESRRRRLAAYFTPPHLVEYVIGILEEVGINFGQDRILDPASGGAAFLVPLAAKIVSDSKKHRKSHSDILKSIKATLAGIEIEPQLAKLSQSLVADLLRDKLSFKSEKPCLSIVRANTLKLSAPECLYDAVVGNPPYGRLYRPSSRILEDFSTVITDGYVNLYALFIEQAIRWVRPGGIICLIVPVSFVGGPYFAALRKRIIETAHVLRLDLIDKRSDVFLDVLYDVCVLVLQKKGGVVHSKKARSSLLTVDEAPQELGCIDLPTDSSDRVWALPNGVQDDELFQEGLETLENYGFIAKTGYFVWNREQHRYRLGNTPKSNEVPLFWAHNIRPNIVCKPYHNGSEQNRYGFVKISKDSTAIVKTDAIVLQRTSNRRQKHRLIAAVVRKNKVPGNSGFVSENHTILILPDPEREQTVSLKTLCRLLNTTAVDARFRRMSGSVSVSTKALRHLPLPAAQKVRDAFQPGVDADVAADTAYHESILSHQKADKPAKGGAQ